MKNIYLLIAGLLCAYGLFAQSGQIKGTVIDSAGNTPLLGASVQITRGEGTVTDANGMFTLPCSDSAEVKISYIGYETLTIKTSCGSSLTVALVLTLNNLNTVEITATSDPNKTQLYQPISIAKIYDREITRSIGLTLDDAINTNIPGVYMQRRTFSAGQQFNIRGYGNGARGTNGISSNFDGQGYKVYLNGIPVTDAEGVTQMDDIDFGSIGNVEVIKGPAGSLYGLAIAGVVDLKTVKPEPGKISIGQNLLFGSYGLQRYTTHVAISKARSSFLVNYGRQKYDGFMPHIASNKHFVNLIGEFAPNEKQTISTYVGFSKSYDERNGELTVLQYDTLDYSGNQRYIKNNAHSEVISFRAGVSHTYQFAGWISNTTSFYGTGVSLNNSSAGGWTDKSTLNYGLRSSFNIQFNLGGSFKLSGVTGLEAQMQNAQTVGYTMVADSSNLTGYNIIGPIRSNQYTTTKTLSAFTEWTLGLPFDFSLTAGLGYSVVGIQLNDHLYSASNNTTTSAPKPTSYQNTFGNMFSPHVAINKVFSKKASVYASFSQAYKAPVSSYFFIPVTGEVLTGLKPEKGTQYEVGTKGALLKDRLNYQVAFFYAQFTNKITTVAVPDSTGTATAYTYAVNGGTQNHMGVELAIRTVAYKSDKFVKSLNPFANMAYSHFRYGDFKYQQLSSDKTTIVEVDYTDNVVVGVPPITFNLGLDLITKPGLYANVTFSYRDAMYFTSDNTMETDAYGLLNAKIGYQTVFFKHLGVEAYVGAVNLTGTQYYAMVFLNQLPDAYIPAPREVNFFGGLNLKYIF